MTKLDSKLAAHVLEEIAHALKIAGEVQFKREIDDINFEIKKINESKAQAVFLDLVISHLIMSAKFRGCHDQA